MQLFIGLSCLNNVGFRGYVSKNIDKLASFLNLKKASFTICEFPEKEVLKLKETCGNIGKMPTSSCEAFCEHVLYDGILTRNSTTPCL